MLQVLLKKLTLDSLKCHKIFADIPHTISATKPELTALDRSSIFSDLNMDRLLERTGRVHSDVGILVFDVIGNGPSDHSEERNCKSVIITACLVILRFGQQPADQ